MTMSQRFWLRYNYSIILLTNVFIIIIIYHVYDHFFTKYYNINCASQGITVPSGPAYDEVYGFILMIIPAFVARKTVILMMIYVCCVYTIFALLPLIYPYSVSMGCYTMGGDNDDQTATGMLYVISYLFMVFAFYIVTLVDVLSRFFSATRRFFLRK